MNGHVKDLWHTGKGKDRKKTSRYGKGKRWQVRWIDLSGNRHTQVFANLDEANSILQQINVKKLRGAYLDPKAGRISFAEWGDAWLAGKSGDESTMVARELQWRLHVKPYLGKYAIIEIKTQEIRNWLRELENKGLGLKTRHMIRAYVFQMLKSAVDDEIIARNPLEADSTRLSSPEKVRIEPWTLETVFAVHHGLEDRYAILAYLGAFLGLRQGEAFGLAVEDIDFLRGVVHVRRQVKHVHPAIIFAQPKFRKERVVPLPEELGLAISAHLQRWPAQPVTLPYQRTTGNPITVNLITTTREKKAVNRNYFNGAHWRAATSAIGLGPERKNGFHALRHCFASTFLGSGGSIRDLAEYLGHSDPGFTLKVYTHLMPDSQEKMRNAMGNLMGQALEAFGNPIGNTEVTRKKIASEITPMKREIRGNVLG